MRIDIEVHGAKELARDLDNVEAELVPKLSKVVFRGAMNVKNEMQQDARSSGHYKHFHRSIDFDMHGDLEAEIGPNPDKIQGPLDNLLYFGRSNTSGVLDINGPLKREEPRFVKAVGDVARDVL